jgi:membrane protein DedA with SNARE-associated domain
MTVLGKLNKSELWVAVGAIVGNFTTASTGEDWGKVLAQVVASVTAMVYIVARTWFKSRTPTP